MNIEENIEKLKSFVSYEEGERIRKEIHEWNIKNYKRQYSYQEYIEFMNRHLCKFEITHPQSTNFPEYYTLFSIVSQHVRGNCIEECLDKAIEYENGKPRFWYFNNDEVTYLVYDKTTLKTNEIRKIFK